jgi:serine/threonine protein kinase
MSEESENCPKCGAPIPENAPDGLCPKCLLLGANTDTEPGYTSTLRLPKPDAPSVEQLGEAFPQMEILELIGQGGMGYVYKARQQRLDRIVALKILPETLANDPAFAERFSREGRLLAKLNHPNIVTVHDFGVTDPLTVEDATNETVATAAPKGVSPSPADPKTVTPTHRYCYLMMEYVDGANLRQAMRAGRFTPEQALNVVPKVCDALQYAHDEGVLHRDIKPENILVDTKGRVKIADFGIAKMVDPAEGQAEITLTGAGSTLGTPHYMAPEQIEQPSKVDHRADLYSLGVVFYEMLTGELPIGRFAPPSEKTNVNSQVDEIVFRALEKERELRQQSATEIKTAVEHAGHQPPPIRQPRGGVVKTAQCFSTTPDHLQTFKARFAHPFTSAGDLMLKKEQLVFESNDSVMVIPLDSIRDVSVGQLEWWAQKGGISIISITMEKDGRERTFMFRPSGPWPEPVLQSNRHCTDWADAIRQGVATVGAAKPRETPPDSLPLPSAPRWIMPVSIVILLCAPLLGFVGAGIAAAGEQNNVLITIAAGFVLLGLVLVAGILTLTACLMYITTRWAIDRGNLHRLTMPIGLGVSPARNPQSGGVNFAFGLVMFYTAAVLAFPLAGIFRLNEGGLVGLVIAGFVASVIATVMIWDRGTQSRAWLRIGSVIGALLSLPTIGFGGFFLYAMTEEMGGWNPAVSEAIFVPLSILGMFLLPWATLRLHSACGAISKPDIAGAGAAGHVNPWPHRIFWLLIIVLVLPVLLFLLFLFVPYLAFQKRAPAAEMQVVLNSVSTSHNLVIVDLDLWTKDRRLSMSSKYSGPALSESLTNSTPRPANAVVVFPTPIGKEPLVGNRLDATMVGRKPTDYRVAFALKDAKTAALAAIVIEETFANMRVAKPHVRGQLFLFHIKGDDNTETYASIDFKRARKVSFREEIRPDSPPPLPPRMEQASEKLQKLSRQQRRPIDMLGNLPVTLMIKDVKLISVTGRGEFNGPSVAVRRPPSVSYSNRLVQASIEIRTRPGVPAIGFNYQGAALEPGFLGAIDRSMQQSKVEPAPGVSQLAFQLGLGPQPETMMSTTLLIPFPDEAAAREAVRQLKRIQQQPLTRTLERDRKDKQLKLGFFNVPKTSQGAYSAWFVFAPPREPRPAPLPPRFLNQPDEPIATDATAVNEQKLVGTWENTAISFAKASLTFAEDHRYVAEVRFLTKRAVSRGTWRVDGDTFVTTVEESDNPKDVGNTEQVEIVTLTDTMLVTRNPGTDGTPKLNTFRRVATVTGPKAIDREVDTPTRRTFDLRHQLASEIKDELRGILGSEDWPKATVRESNQSLTVHGPAKVLDRAQTFVAVMDWPTGIARRPDFEYPRGSVMDAMRSFFYACAIEDNYQVFNKMLSVTALNKLIGAGPLGPEFLLNEDKRAIAEKELREADWTGKEEKFRELVAEMNRYPLKSLRQEPGVAIGFGARSSVIAKFGGERGRALRFSVSMESRKKKDLPVRYLIDSWTVVESAAKK